MADDAPQMPRYRRHLELGLETVAYRGRLERMPPHAHEEYQLTLYDGGPRRFSIGRQDLVGGRRTTVIIQAGEPHSSVPATDESLCLRTFYLEPRVIAEAADAIWRGRATVAFRDALVADAATVERLREAHRALDRKDLESEVKLCVALEQLVQRYATPTGPVRPLTGTQSRIAQARDLLVDRLAENVGLDELAEVAGLSRFHLIRLFRSQYGLTPFAYQRNQRVDRARAVLREGGSIVDAAATAGFADQSHLGRTFRAVMGATPGQYRRSFAAGPRAAAALRAEDLR